MIIKTLVENTSISPEFKSKHGLSLYIETQNHKILFDLGKDKLFLYNAQKMGIDISQVNIVVISHGHKDHGGALSLFLENNSKAKVYIRENAFENHYTKALGLNVNIGLDPSLKTHPQVVLTQGSLEINNRLSLFSKLEKGPLYSSANNSLYMEQQGKTLLDDFSHEQYLIVSENNKKILFSGCSHLGIVNIKAHGEEIAHQPFSHVVGGFHLYNPSLKKSESPELITAIAQNLKSDSTKYFTGHCTGEKAFNLLKETMGDQLSYLSTGSIVEI